MLNSGGKVKYITVSHIVMGEQQKKAKPRRAAAGPGQSGRQRQGSEEGFGINDILDTPVEIPKRGQVKENMIVDGKVTITNQTDMPREVLCCKYNEDFEKIGVGTSDGLLIITKTGTNDILLTLGDDEVKGAAAPLTAIKHRPVSKNYPINNCFTCTYANGCVKCWNYEFGQCIYTIREKRQTFGIAYHPRLPKFVTYGDDLKIYLYDEETKTQERILQKSENLENHDGPTSRVFAGCFNPRSNYDLLTGGWDDVVHFWDLRQPHAVRHLSGIHMCGEGIDINMKGTEILTCAYQTAQTISLWDYANATLISSIEPDAYNSKLYCGKYATKDYFVCGGTDPNILRIVDLQTYATVASIVNVPDGVFSVDLGPPKKSKRPEEKQQTARKSDFTVMPKLAFVAGKRLYQIDFIS